jgi:hypothetical protein
MSRRLAIKSANQRNYAWYARQQMALINKSQAIRAAKFIKY